MGTIYPQRTSLPRGPHALERGDVRASQRGRLLAAAAEIAAERGWAGLTVSGITRGAGVSPATFYEHFADKQDCFLSACEHGVEALLAETGSAFDAGAPWRTGIRAVVARFVAVLAREPAFARAFLLELPAAGEAGRECRAAALESFADFHRVLGAIARRQEPALGELTAPLRRALVGAIADMAGEALRRGGAPALLAIEDDIVALVVTLYEGAR